MNRLLGPVEAWRLVGVRMPGADLFAGVADFGDWEEVAEIESLWNERTAGLLGNLSAVPREHWASGPGSAYLMGPFIFRAPGRFGNGAYGVLYAGLEERTALAEVAWHRARFLRESGQPRQTLDHQLLDLLFEGTIDDLRESEAPGLYAPDSWAEGQALGARIRAAGADGILYSSVRHKGGDCLAGFRPHAFSRCRFVRYVQFFWDGERLLGEGLPAC